jgi:prevent-host-death family protein
MSTTTAAAEANRNFSGLLALVKAGQTVTITSHGQPVARMAPVAAGSAVTAAARSALFTRLKQARVRRAGRWTRDELYENPT